MDGSIQGYTAYLSKPYYAKPGAAAIAPDKCSDENAEHISVSGETEAAKGGHAGKQDAAYRGFSNMTQEEVTD